MIFWALVSARGALGAAMEGADVSWVVLALQSAERSSTLPGPGPWSVRHWMGAALYVGLFLLALWGMARLARGAALDTLDGTAVGAGPDVSVVAGVSSTAASPPPADA
jgi:hypothetical protein